MAYLSVLRKLSDYQQFAALKTQADQYWQETADVEVLPLRAIAYAQLGERDVLVPLLELIQQYQTQLSQDALVDLAGVYCLLLRVDFAAALLEPIVLAQPDHALALARLAWCRMQQDLPDEAIVLYQNALSIASHRMPLWLALVRLYLQARFIDLAQSTLNQAIARFTELRTELPEQTVAIFTEQLRAYQLEIWVLEENLAQAEEWLAEKQGQLPEETWVALVNVYANVLAQHNLHAEAEQILRDSLKKFPDQTALLSQLAELAQIQGRTLQAIQLVRRLIKLTQQAQKPECALVIRLANLYLFFNDEEAERQAHKAEALFAQMQPTVELTGVMLQQLGWQVKTTLAQVAVQQQKYDLAEQLFQEILAENAYSVGALQGLGQLYMQLGKIDQAIELFDRVKEIDPAKGYSALISARKFPEDDAVLARMEKLARLPSVEGSVRTSLLFQLAATWEKRKDYAKAFELAQQANEASRKLLRYDGKTHRNYCARLRYAFSKSLYQHRPNYGHASSLPVFVVGMPRSGTTLVEQIIASHSKVFGAGELGIIPARVQGLNRWEQHIGSGRSFPDVIDDMNSYVTQGIAQGIVDELREFDADATYIVDKLPHNFENIGFIKFLFPNAKIISVRRDPRDIAISNYFTDYQAKHGGMGFAYDLTDIGEQLADHNLLMHHWHQTFPNEILEIRYEDVVEDLEGSARKMLDYLGLDWEPQVLAFNELDRAVKTASVWQVRQPIYKTSKAKWQRYQDYLAPLIQGTNAKITWDEIKMISLPEPSYLQTGVAHFNAQQLDDAEMCFKKLLHFIPKHAAANFMLGLVYASKGYLVDAIPLMEQALTTCPWKQPWRDDLARAYELNGQPEQAERVRQKQKIEEGVFFEQGELEVMPEGNALSRV